MSREKAVPRDQIRPRSKTRGSTTEPSKRELDKQLDDALKMTFPASDPVSVGQPTTDEPRRPLDRRPPLFDKALVERQAKKVAKRAETKGRSGKPPATP